MTPMTVSLKKQTNFKQLLTCVTLQLVNRVTESPKVKIIIKQQERKH